MCPIYSRRPPVLFAPRQSSRRWPELLFSEAPSPTKRRIAVLRTRAPPLFLRRSRAETGTISCSRARIYLRRILFQFCVSRSCARLVLHSGLPALLVCPPKLETWG